MSASPSSLIAGREFRLLIGGELTQASQGHTRDTIDPSTGLVLTTVPEAQSEDVASAVAAAKDAQHSWQAIGLRARTKHFERLAELVADARDELAMLDALDAGNPLRAMRRDIDRAINTIKIWPGLALTVEGRAVDASPGNLHYTRHEPYGVVGQLLAFNHPAMFAIKSVLPPLIVGNTVVVKPAVQTPLSALAFAEIAREALPPGVLNILSGGAKTGDHLVTHPAVKRLDFTGSLQTALTIQARAATAGLKHITFELSGKNAMIVFPDADLTTTVDAGVRSMGFESCQGQSCGSASRVFVHRSLYDDFVEHYAARLADLRLGPAYDDAYTMGPLVSAAQLALVTDYISLGKEEGARLVYGGKQPNNGYAGYFLEPTLFADVNATMTIAREEIFGPVVTILPWEDYGDLIANVNAVDYGLTASIWTNDLHLAHKTAQHVAAGYVWINDVSTHYLGMPFGGVKMSGLGRKESVEELESYLETKAINVILDAAATSPHLSS